jgi:hypothetical protein
MPHRDAGRGHVGLGLGDGVFAEMEDRGGQHRAGAAFGHALDQVIEIADAARGDHGDRDGVGDGAGEGDVEALFRAVAVHRGQQDLARALLGHGLREFHRVDAGGFAARHG